MRLTQPINIKYKNEVNKLGDALIRARQIVCASNEGINLSSTQQLRLVLICCLALMKRYSMPKGPNDYTISSFESICSHFKNISVGKRDWVEDYLMLNGDVDLTETIQEIQKCYTPKTFPYLLPYALEILEYGEHDLHGAERDRRNGIVTPKKKKRGIYYTPNDIVVYMVDTCLEELQKMPGHISLKNYKYIDYSCGSGIFILYILDALCRSDNADDVSDHISVIKNSLYGVDISPLAIDITRFLIVAYVSLMVGDKELDYDSLLRVLEQNIICADAVIAQEFSHEHPNFPTKFNCVIGNPPYVSTTVREHRNERFYRSNLFIPFIDNLIDHSNESSMSALIIPLSFAYNSHTGFNKIRKRIEQDPAVWKIENYDRSPDSLFGDDVKSRNCIIFRKSNHESKRIFTTGLLRWTSVNRNEFLMSPKNHADITDISIEPFIPKIGGAIELQAYKKLCSSETSLLTMLKRSSPETKKMLVLNSTAYNWICAYDHIPSVVDKHGDEIISKEKKYFSLESKEDLYFVLACLNSVTAFWFWTVIGDGFHVTNRFLECFCLEKRLFDTDHFEQLFKLGEQFSKELRSHPTRSINKGKIITNYDHTKIIDIAFKIDTIISQKLLLPDGYPEYLHEWYNQIVCCGRVK